MSALATALVKLGHEVSGADRNLNTPNIKNLISLGISVFPDDGSGIYETIDEVVVSTAIEETNKDLVKARSLGIKITHRARALADALKGYKLIAVAGTCGKSTVTAMLGHILSVCGLEPMCVNGANVPGWTGAVKFGKGEYAVAEVDESDKSLVAFKPYAAIITNSSADHYSKSEMDEVFDNFISGIKGPVIDARKEVYKPEDFNLQNASLAVRMAVAMGVDKDAAEMAMESFGGVERRLQRISGALVRPVVFDDYAHNPEKLRSMWMALSKDYSRICALWRPHGYAPLKKMRVDLAKMFNGVLREGDKLFVLPVYDAGGTVDRSENSDALVAMIPRSELVNDLDDAYLRMSKDALNFDAIVTCGARDPELPALARRLGEYVLNLNR
jgi:UDP-N-acetylmuramate--alanine ligase